VEILAAPGEHPAQRFSVTCLITAERVDRAGLRASLLALPLSQGVLSGMRGQLRVQAHVADPATLLATAARFGQVSASVSEDRLAPTPAELVRRRQVAIVTDTGADVPAEAVARLGIHLVPQRLSLGGRDLIDGVSLSPQEFYAQMRESPVPPRTSQPAPGDFRRMFESLLSHHDQVIDVSLGGGFSGTYQSAKSVAARTAVDRVAVFDSRQVAASQGLLTIWAAEAAQAGLTAPRLLAGLEQMRARSSVFALVRDIRYAVRGGRVPRVAERVTRLLGVSLLLRNRPNGKLGLGGAIWGQSDLPGKFARRVLRPLRRDRRYRFIIGHGDCPGDAERVRQVLTASGIVIDRIWVVETGVAVGAHAGPGSLVIGVQDYAAPQS